MLHKKAVARELYLSSVGMQSGGRVFHKCTKGGGGLAAYLQWYTSQFNKPPLPTSSFLPIPGFTYFFILFFFCILTNFIFIWSILLHPLPPLEWDLSTLSHIGKIKITIEEMNLIYDKAILITICNKSPRFTRLSIKNKTID
jgi:hypothetical protein